MKDNQLEAQENIAANLEHFIFPLLARMKRRATSTDKRNLELLETRLNDLTNQFGMKILNKKWKLTTTEIDICNLIRSGLSTKEIANLLCSSIRTIENHRNNIRKKFGLSDRNTDLFTYLESL